MFINKIYFLLMAAIILPGCFRKNEKQQEDGNMKAGMIAAEKAFSDLSRQQGTKHALMQYIDSNGVLLRPGTFPMVGADAIDFISQANDTLYTMVWQPKGGSVAASGELGYTYGVYTIIPKNNGDTLNGTYVNVWKKQPDGTWKLLLDSGNEGIETNDN